MDVNCTDFTYIYNMYIISQLTVQKVVLQNTVFYILNGETKLYNINRDFKRKVAH